MMSNANSPRSSNNCELHPLIHTLLKFNLVQDVEKKKAEPKNLQFLSLNRDIVAMPLQSEEVKGDYLDRCMKTIPKVMTIKLNT